MQPNRLITSACLAALLALAPLTAPAQPQVADTPPPGTPFDLQSMLWQKDVNHDGKVTLEEFCAGAADQAACATRHRQLDQNGDGVISQDDLAQRFQELDSDGDGRVSRQEFMAKWKDAQNAASHYQRLDSDSDGYITREEFMGGWATIPVWAW